MQNTKALKYCHLHSKRFCPEVSTRQIFGNFVALVSLFAKIVSKKLEPLRGKKWKRPLCPLYLCILVEGPPSQSNYPGVKVTHKTSPQQTAEHMQHCVVLVIDNALSKNELQMFPQDKMCNRNHGDRCWRDGRWSLHCGTVLTLLLFYFLSFYFYFLFKPVIYALSFLCLDYVQLCTFVSACCWDALSKPAGCRLPAEV